MSYQRFPVAVEHEYHAFYTTAGSLGTADRGLTSMEPVVNNVMEEYYLWTNKLRRGNFSYSGHEAFVSVP
jgi:hypothetical protein